MKKIIVAIVCLAMLSSFARRQGDVASKIQFKLEVPQGWTAEHVALTGKVSDGGVEDLRLTPGFNDPKSDQYWSHTSLWTVENTFNTDAESIKNALTTYYADQLIKNIKKHKVPAQKILQVKTWMLELAKESNDSRTFYGAVSMLDYKTQLPISLNCVVHVRSNAAQNKTFIFYEFSPNPLNNVIWKTLDQFWLEFDFVSSQPNNSN